MRDRSKKQFQLWLGEFALSMLAKEQLAIGNVITFINVL